MTYLSGFMLSLIYEMRQVNTLSKKQHFVKLVFHFIISLAGFMHFAFLDFQNDLKLDEEINQDGWPIAGGWHTFFLQQAREPFSMEGAALSNI